MNRRPLLDLALVLLLLPSLMTLTTVIIHRIRQAQIQRRERAPELVVQNLPCLIVRGNGVVSLAMQSVVITAKSPVFEAVGES